MSFKPGDLSSEFIIIINYYNIVHILYTQNYYKRIVHLYIIELLSQTLRWYDIIIIIQHNDLMTLLLLSILLYIGIRYQRKLQPLYYDTASHH